MVSAVKGTALNDVNMAQAATNTYEIFSRDDTNYLVRNYVCASFDDLQTIRLACLRSIVASLPNFDLNTEILTNEGDGLLLSYKHNISGKTIPVLRVTHWNDIKPHVSLFATSWHEDKHLKCSDLVNIQRQLESEPESLSFPTISIFTASWQLSCKGHFKKDKFQLN